MTTVTHSYTVLYIQVCNSDHNNKRNHSINHLLLTLLYRGVQVVHLVPMLQWRGRGYEQSSLAVSMSPLLLAHSCSCLTEGGQRRPPWGERVGGRRGNGLLAGRWQWVATSSEDRPEQWPPPVRETLRHRVNVRERQWLTSSVCDAVKCSMSDNTVCLYLILCPCQSQSA